MFLHQQTWLVLIQRVALSTIDMKQELENKLVTDFPNIFMMNRLSPGTAHWGLECGDGWYQLIHNLCTDIMNYCRAKGLRIPVAEQVKEKFGRLRFYVDEANQGLYDIIDHYEKASGYTCEVCGEGGKTIAKNHWLTTLCEKHNEV